MRAKDFETMCKAFRENAAEVESTAYGREMAYATSLESILRDIMVNDMEANQASLDRMDLEQRNISRKVHV